MLRIILTSVNKMAFCGLGGQVVSTYNASQAELSVYVHCSNPSLTYSRDNYLDNRPYALKRMRKIKIKHGLINIDINPSDGNFSHASSKQHTYEVAEIKAKVNYEKKIMFNLKQNCKSFYYY